MKRKFHQEVYIGFASLIFSLLIFAINNNIPSEAALMPRLLAGVMTVLSIFIIHRGLGLSKMPKEEQPDEYLSWAGLKIPLITWGIVVLYFLLFRFVGYFIATAIVLPLLMRFMKRTSWKTILAIDGAFLLIIYFVFVKVLKMSVNAFGMLERLF